MNTIRLSPSGPPISGSSGGPLDPGDGLVMRQDDIGTLVTGGATIPAEPGYPLKPDPTDAFQADVVASLTDPKPNAAYSAEVRVDITNTVAAPHTVELIIDVRYDGGPWSVLASNQHAITDLGNREVTVNQIIAAGNAAPWSVPAGASLIEVRGRIVNPAAAGVEILSNFGAGTVYIALREHLA